MTLNQDRAPKQPFSIDGVMEHVIGAPARRPGWSSTGPLLVSSTAPLLRLYFLNARISLVFAAGAAAGMPVPKNGLVSASPASKPELNGCAWAL